MKIIVIATGGTIGSSVGHTGWISPDKNAPHYVVQEFCRQYPELAADIQIDCRMPYQILSENLNAGYLITLLEEVRTDIETGDYDGIIICHGTDTLQYTAAMLEEIYGHAGVPILLASSNYPLEDKRSNGLYNFYYAVRRLKDGFRGIGVVYQNADGNTYIHRGNRLLEHVAFEDDLHSMHNQVAGYYNIEGVWIPGALEQPEEAGEALAERIPDYRRLNSDSGIMWLHNTPGISYPTPAQYAGIKAVMIQSYHAGTIRIDNTFRQFVAKAAQRKIPVYLVGIEEIQGNYETKKAYDSCGAMILEGIAPIAAYCRIWLEVSQD